jgi:hypothetical protein
MYYSYVEIEYVATSFSPARTDLALTLLKVSLVAMTLPVPTPHAQRMKSPVWVAAVVVHSLLFLCVASNLKAAVVTIGISLKGLLVPASMIILISQGAPKNEVNPGYVTAPYSVGALIAFTLSLVEPSWSSTIVSVTRLHRFKQLCLLMRNAVVFDPVPKRHINFVFGRRRVPPAILNLWRA